MYGVSYIYLTFFEIECGVNRMKNPDLHTHIVHNVMLGKNIAYIKAINKILNKRYR